MNPKFYYQIVYTFPQNPQPEIEVFFVLEEDVSEKLYNRMRIVTNPPEELIKLPRIKVSIMSGYYEIPEGIYVRKIFNFHV